MAFTNSQIDRLGERLRNAEPVVLEDATMYEEWRANHIPALEETIAAIHDELEREVVSRLKTLESAIAKLRRQSIRLSRMGDIAGCRLVVNDRRTQDASVTALALRYPQARVNDFRSTPHSGYRAVHLYVQGTGRRQVEVQVRTRAQHAWANVSEQLSTRYDPGIKYGAGPRWARDALMLASEDVHLLEVASQEFEDAHTDAAGARLRRQLDTLTGRLERLGTIDNERST